MARFRLKLPLIIIVFSAVLVGTCASAQELNDEPTTKPRRYRCGDTRAPKDEPCFTDPVAKYTPDPDGYLQDVVYGRYKGIVSVEFTVQPDGTTANVAIRRSVDSKVDEKALKTVRKWRFAPATYGGKPIAVKTQVEFVYGTVGGKPSS